MAGFTDTNNQYLIRTSLWSRQIKELLLDELNAMKFVRVISDFPDGYTINIPSIGEAETADFVEGQAIKYNAMDEVVKTSVHLKLSYMLETPKSFSPLYGTDEKIGQSAGKERNESDRIRVGLVCRTIRRRRLYNFL